jgi:hypothetical protein
MEEFIACGMYPLAVDAGFNRVATRTTSVSKLKVLLPKFIAIHKDNNEDDVQFLARVELEAEGIVGSYTKAKHDACLAHMRNGGWLNHVFELAGVAYGPHAMPGTDKFTEVVQKRKLDAAGKNLSKRPKVEGKKKMDAAKIAPSWGKASLKWLSSAEVASGRPLKQSKKTVTHPTAAMTTTCVPTGALSSKVAAGASGSKGTSSVKKMVMPVHKHRVPVIGLWRRRLWKNLKSHRHTVEWLGIQRPKLHQGQSLVANHPRHRCPAPCQGLRLRLHFKSLHLLMLAELHF